MRFPMLQVIATMMEGCCVAMARSSVLGCRGGPADLADARAFCEQFFSFYNHEHRHSGIGLHTPASVHHGTAVQVRAHRAVTLDAAYAAHPDRFRRPPVPPRLPAAAWINQPSREALIQNN